MTIWLQLAGSLRQVEVAARFTGRAAEFRVDGKGIIADVFELQPGLLSLVVGGRQHRFSLDGDAVLVDGKRLEFEVADPRSLRARRGAAVRDDGPRPVKAPMPGRVVRVLVAIGDEVASGQGVVVIEAMKMQNELKSGKAGRVMKVTATVGETVSQGDVLVIVG